MLVPNFFIIRFKKEIGITQSKTSLEAYLINGLV